MNIEKRDLRIEEGEEARSDGGPGQVDPWWRGAGQRPLGRGRGVRTDLGAG